MAVPAFATPIPWRLLVPLIPWAVLVLVLIAAILIGVKLFGSRNP